MDKIKQNQIDNQRNKVDYQPDPQAACIPFGSELVSQENQRRMIEKGHTVRKDGKNTYKEVAYCELHYTSNLERKILKVIRDNKIQLEERNIGFAFIYFNPAGDKLLQRMFKRQFR